MDRAEPPSTLRVSVAYSPGPGRVDEIELTLPAGASVGQALAASGLQQRYPALTLEAAAVGVWGALCAHGQALRDGDRVEVYRGLRVDPMQARRLRAQAQRAVKR